MTFHRFDEFADVLEGEIDAGEAHPGDPVDGLEGFHDPFPNFFGGDFRDEGGGELSLDRVDDREPVFVADGALLAGAVEASENFVAIPWFLSSILFEDDRKGELRVFEGREASGAGLTFTAASNGVALTNESAIDNASIAVSATGATHRPSSGH